MTGGVGQTQRRSRVASLLKGLASPRLTVAFFLLTAGSALAIGQGWVVPTFAMLLPFAFLVLNLGAAILQHPRFRSDLPLLLFHLTLLVLIGLFLLGRLTYLYGSVSVTRDTSFNGIIDKLEVGPLHNRDFSGLRFVHGGLTERFNDEVGHHVDIRSRIRWQDEQMRWQETELGFGYPVIIDGYRIYPSGRRGYSPIFLWQATDGREEVGTVQLFGPAENVMENTNDWVMPNGVAAWLQLETDVSGPPALGTVRLDLGADALAHKLILRVGDDRHVIKLGDSVDLPGGRLRYVKLESWAGYSLIYDPTESWLIATILIAIGSLCWFYFQRFRQRPLAVPEA